MSFRLVPNSVTLNDLERRNGRYIALFQARPGFRRYSLFTGELVLVAVYDVDIKAKDIRSSRFNFKV